MTHASPERAGPTIVVGYDGSEAARVAVRHACARAGGEGRVIVVLSVGTPTEPWVVAGPEFLIEDPVEHGRAKLDELVMGEAEALTETDFDVEVARDSPGKAIVEAARRHGADEIAIGTRGAGRIGSLLGSVAQDVLHRADRPVLVIPKHAVDAQRESGETVLSTSSEPEGSRR